MGGAKDFGLFGDGSSSQPGDGTAGNGNGGPRATPKPASAPKKPKVVSSKKQTSQKITLVSTKLTDLKVLRNKVENSALLLGYQETCLKFELGSVVLQ